MTATVTKSRSRKQHAEAIEFTCHAPEAQSVFLAGDFNQWNPEATPMQKADEGIWTVKLKLAPGRYEFKFIIDEHWSCKPGCRDHDLSCPNCVINAFGTMNRVIEVA